MKGFWTVIKRLRPLIHLTLFYVMSFGETRVRIFPRGVASADGFPHPFSPNSPQIRQNINRLPWIDPGSGAGRRTRRMQEHSPPSQCLPDPLDHVNSCLAPHSTSWSPLRVRQTRFIAFITASTDASMMSSLEALASKILPRSSSTAMVT